MGRQTSPAKDREILRIGGGKLHHKTTPAIAKTARTKTQYTDETSAIGLIREPIPGGSSIGRPHISSGLQPGAQARAVVKPLLGFRFILESGNALLLAAWMGRDDLPAPPARNRPDDKLNLVGELHHLARSFAAAAT